MDTVPTAQADSDEKTLYTERAILATTALGGPLGGTFLLAHNFRALRREDELRWTWIIGIAATISIPFLGSIADKTLPESLNRSLYLIWEIPVFFVVRSLLKQPIQNHLASGGKKASAWKASGFGFAALTISLLYIVIFVVTTTKSITPIPQFQRSVIEINQSGGRIYYDSAVISQSDARTIGAIFESPSYFGLAGRKFEILYYRDKDGKYVVLVPVNHRSVSNKRLESLIQGILKDLKGAYSTRVYQFRLVAIDSTGIRDEKYIESD